MEAAPAAVTLTLTVRNGLYASNGQTLAALGTACVDDGTATTAFHAHQETVGTGAADFGRLVGALHGGAQYLLGVWGPTAVLGL